MTVMAIDTMLAISALLAGMLLPAAELPVVCRFVSPEGCANAFMQLAGTRGGDR
jgi:hypothetical protein